MINTCMSHGELMMITHKMMHVEIVQLHQLSCGSTVEVCFWSITSTMRLYFSFIDGAC